MYLLINLSMAVFVYLLINLSMAAFSLQLASYNMHGFRSGASMLLDLSYIHKIIAVQEHWLRSDDLKKFTSINEDFNFHAISSMDKALSLGLLRGRPFGGVGFLYHKSLQSCFKVLGHDNSNRCLAAKLSLPNKNIVLFNVYFPCVDYTMEYRDEICAISSFIENVMNNESNSDIIIMGDTNFDVNPGNIGFDIFNLILANLNVIPCDDLLGGTISNTYYNESLHASSKIDHFFISRVLKANISQLSIIDSGANLSDHRPISMTLALAGVLRPQGGWSNYSYANSSVRWDKGSIPDYYTLTNENLSNSAIDFSYAHCAGNCNAQVIHCAAIDRHYTCLVNALLQAERRTIPRIPHSSLKPFWNEYLDELKSKSITWHAIWISAGRPPNGWIHKIKICSKLKFKHAIKEAFAKYENRFNDDLCSHFLNKNTPAFWKTWNKKMRSNVAKEVYVNGSNEEKLVADAFADNFESVYFDSNSKLESKKEFFDLLSSNSKTCTVSPAELHSSFSVEQVSRSMLNLKLGKASGPDELSAEHLIHSHPSLVIHICLLFRGIATHGYVPNDFGAGIIIPLLKDKLGDVNDVGNYRGITLIPIFSKLFELVLLEICLPYLNTDDLQFGFKKKLGCDNAIFILSETVDFFNSRGSSVFIATLDFKKAFDRVNHFKLFSTLIRTHIPIWIINILVEWYGKLRVAVRWKCTISKSFNVHSGVRQGSTFSPALFNAFINVFIVNIRNNNIGCHINSNFLGVIMYADDLLLLSASVDGLQKMLNVCHSVSISTDMEFNTKKCACSAVGPASLQAISDMKLGNDVICWEKEFKYLGISFKAGKSLTIDILPIKCKFFTSCNCIFGNLNCLNEIIRLNMIETFCMPILLYASAVLKLSQAQSSELNASWNSAYRRIFGFNQWESVRCFINGLGRLDFSHLKLYLHLKFCRLNLFSNNLTFRSVMNVYCCSYTFNKLCSSAGMLNLSIKRFKELSVGSIKAHVHSSFANS